MPVHIFLNILPGRLLFVLPARFRLFCLVLPCPTSPVPFFDRSPQLFWCVRERALPRRSPWRTCESTVSIFKYPLNGATVCRTSLWLVVLLSCPGAKFLRNFCWPWMVDARERCRRLNVHPSSTTLRSFLFLTRESKQSVYNRGTVLQDSADCFRLVRPAVGPTS